MSAIADRRSEPRVDIELDAIVHPERGRTWACTIRDFCGSGMLLAGTDSRRARTLRDAGLDARVGDEIRVHFTVPGGEGARNYRLTAEVRRIMENAIGVFIPDGMALRAFRDLGIYAQSNPASARGGAPGGAAAGELGRLDPSDAKQLSAQVRRLAARALPSLYKGFFDRAAEELIVLARDAGSNVRQNELFEALNTVEAGSREVAREAGRGVLDHIARPRERSVVVDKRRTGDDAERLTLVDTNAFEDWLAVADIISKAENRFGEELTPLCMQMGMIAPRWSEKEIMPLGPAVLAATFDDAITRLELPRDVRQLLYGYFRDVLVAFLRKLLPALRKLLDESGVLPPSEELGAEARRRGRPKSGSPSPEPPAPADAPKPPEDAASGAMTAAAGGAPVSTGPAGSAGAADAQQPGVANAAELTAGASARGSAPGAAGAHDGVLRAPMGDMFGTARELMQLRRGLPGPDGLPTEMPVSADVRPAPETVYSPDEIRAALARLRRTPAAAGSAESANQTPGVRRRLSEVLAETAGAKQFAPDARDALEVIDDLLGSIHGDATLPDSVKGWLGDLEMTYGQLATENVEFLDTTATPLHPALQLLNELAELGNMADAGDGLDPVLREQVDTVLAEVREDYDGDVAIFEQALERIGPIVERQRRAFSGNLRRVVRQAEGASRLVSARRAVVGAVDERLAQREVPEPVLRLLNPGWRNLLVHSHLRLGPDSEEYRRQLQVIDELVELLETGVGDREALLGEIREGLEDISYEPGRRSQLLGALRDALAGGEVETVRVEAGAAAEVLGLEDAIPERAPQAPSEDATERAEWERCLELARALEVGSWVSLDDETGRKRILTIAWIGEDHTAFTLVNGKGVKVRDLELREFVQSLVDEDVQILEEFDMPLMERASQNMLQNMHNQLAYQATHDALTGLVNRKEFERAVDAAVHETKTEGAEGVVIYMDLDQFKVINNTCGHDAGDELLRALVPNLRHELRGVRGQLARLGGDEFGVLVERCGPADSRAVAEGLLESVREFRFEWNEQHYTLTASVGCVPFGPDGRDVVTLLQQADAACYAAKDAGRNRVQIHEFEDADMAERRSVMEWVARVDEVLREGRIRLTAQKIAPVRNPKTAKPHYEFLMTVVDEDGEATPPVEFINAAETYDRMPAVDRWVVANALDWMSVNHEHLDRVHGFSINLSGRSLNDPGFCDYVVQQLQRTRVPTEKVTFEITETAAFASMESANRFIARLRDLGCTFSLDDFGTGLASYSYLRNLDVDYVKIDGMFVKDLIQNPADYAVVKSVSEIAHFMGKQTIAEFVENAQILDALREIGVDYAQGWGVERPRPLDQVF